MLITASRLGDRPASIADTSFSDAARVDSPNSVHLYSAASAAATRITTTARMKRSFGTTRPKKVNTSVVSTAGADFDSSPKTGMTPASSTRRSPSDAASFATGEVLRSGRKIASSMITPNTAMQTSVSTNAGTVDSVKPQ
jgi:hypothetical protein